MPFDKVDTQVDFPAQERAILAFWQQHAFFEKLRAQNRGKPKWSFLDGPITANNPMGVHHAWGRTYKDIYQRYQAMTGHELRYQNGFDCQGLWVEVEVEKELKLRSKRDIENLVPGDPFASMDKFVQLCKDRVDKFARVQTEQSIRLGYWMDWDREEDWQKPAGERRSYFTMSEENNYTIWSFLKKCHQRGLMYRGYDAMPWCPRCAVGLSQMELHEGYQLVADRSVFVRFPLRGRPNENLLVWTTTPWTLSSNVAAAVNPTLTYVKVRHKDQLYYLAKGALTAKRLEEQFKRKEWVEGVPKLKPLDQLFKEKGGFEIEGEISGKEMIGWTYDGPFDELPAQQHPGGFPNEIAEVVHQQKWGPEQAARAIHQVIAWDMVGEQEGTGIVHIAPGCGKEDFLLCKDDPQHRLVPIGPLDEFGNFLPGFGPLEGKFAVAPETTDWILHNLQEKGLLLATERYPHNYPHCWRCKSQLLFRLVDEWFIGMSWREEIMKVCHEIQWIPEFGLQRELDWLKNMGDWMISKKRFWGLALPIWVDEKTSDFEVIGSIEELQSRAVEGWDQFAGHSPHRPWIDLIKIRNPKTGNLMSRIPDVGNPWLDAGIVPFSTVKFNTDRAYWEKWFPADFITESFPGQFRNWFYSLLAMSTMLVQRAPFKVLLGHGQVRDQWGDEMHKSKGNSIPFEGAADGSDLPGKAKKGFEIKHELRAGEQPLVPGALEVAVLEEEREGKKGRVVQAFCEPIGADLLRWVYCRQNPAQNINFGPGPSAEIRSKFTMKLWNSYAFFCDLARIDHFDPTAAQVPVAERPDIDRWILSDLQKLIQKGHTAFQTFDVQSFCLEAEDFVDSRLSNWYVRSTKRRFWKSEQGQDKQAAYQTLYTVLLTLARAFAPVIPFLTEVMYQNLKSSQDKAESVHHLPYPQADASLLDEDLTAEMGALLKLVSLGHSVRKVAKIKVRQPLAELKIQAGDDCEQRAVARFGDQICDELNLKKVTVHHPTKGELLTVELKPNLKTLGPKLGQHLKTSLPPMNTKEAAAQLLGSLPLTIQLPEGAAVQLVQEDFLVTFKAEEGWLGLADRKTQLALDTRISAALELEGLAREVIRHVQTTRKEADLALEDRIRLFLQTDSEKLRQAIDAHRDYISEETLATEWASASLSGEAFRTTVKVEGSNLGIELQRVGLGGQKPPD